MEHGIVDLTHHLCFGLKSIARKCQSSVMKTETHWNVGCVPGTQHMCLIENGCVSWKSPKPVIICAPELGYMHQKLLNITIWDLFYWFICGLLMFCLPHVFFL